MSQIPDSRRPKFRLTVKLDYEWDADIVRWIESLPEGYRSEAVRHVIRQYLAMQSVPDIDEIRQVVAEELGKALVGRQITSLKVKKASTI